MKNQTSLSKKVGQLFMFGFEGYSINQEIKNLVREFQPGGFILFQRNLNSLLQTQKLLNDLHSLSVECSYENMPPFLAIDQEGGSIVVRRYSEATWFPGNMSLGALKDHSAAYQCASSLAQELAVAGFNMNLAPVLDLATNLLNPSVGLRSFSDAPELVSDLGLATIKGFLDEHIIPVGKHFPGLGPAVQDTHQEKAVISTGFEEFSKLHLIPFEKAIESRIPALMVNHACYRFSDQKELLPASLSAYIIQKLLREKMNFKGLILTDDLNMKAVSSLYDPGTLALKALKAGADILLFCKDMSIQKEAYRAVLENFENGNIPENYLTESIQRIKALKERFLNKYPEPAKIKVDFKSNQELAVKTAALAITVINHSAFDLPLEKDRQIRSVYIWAEENSKAANQVKIFTETIKNMDFEIERLETNKSNFYEIIENAFKSKLKIGYFIFLVKNLYQAEPSLLDKFHNFFKRLSEKKDLNLIFAALGNPLDLTLLPKRNNIQILTFGDSPTHLQALALVLSGDIKPRGQLPCSISRP